jgi:hypothetical protein
MMGITNLWWREGVLNLNNLLNVFPAEEEMLRCNKEILANCTVKADA